MDGVLLLSIGHPSYARWTENMIVSLRAYSSNVPIHVLTDGNYINENGLADKVIKLDYSDYTTDSGKLFPAKAKLSIFDYSEFDKTLYLDVDGVSIKDIRPLFDLPGYFQCQVNGVSTLEHDNLDASLWVKIEKVFEKFNLPADTKVPGTNSSFQYFTKSKEAAKLYGYAKNNLTNHSFELNELRYTWGHSKTQPDELYMNIALAQVGLIPDMKPVLYLRRRNQGGTRTSFDVIKDNYYIIGCWGDQTYNHHEISGTGDRRSGLYNKVCWDAYNKLGLTFQDSFHQLIKHKVYGNPIR